MAMILGGVMALVLVGPEARYWLKGKVTTGHFAALGREISADGGGRQWIDYDYLDEPNHRLCGGNAEIRPGFVPPEPLKIEYVGEMSRLAGTHDRRQIAAAAVGIAAATCGLIWRRRLR